MSETFKGTLYALLAVAMFATLGTGFKMAVTRMSSYSVVVWIAIWATLSSVRQASWAGDGSQGWVFFSYAQPGVTLTLIRVLPDDGTP